jgi:hypothetical protein
MASGPPVFSPALYPSAEFRAYTMRLGSTLIKSAFWMFQLPVLLLLSIGLAGQAPPSAPLSNLPDAPAPKPLRSDVDTPADKRVLGVLPNYRTANSAAAAISQAYHFDDRYAGSASETLVEQCAVDTAAQVLKEFWLDIKRKLFNKRQGTP